MARKYADVLEPEKGRDLCRIALTEEANGGYGKDPNLLTENLSVREKTILICKTCDGIMKDACLSSSGEHYCSGCEKNPNSKQTPNLAVREMINLLNCSCPLSERGCKWLGMLEDCENHLDTCGYVHETCELECGVVLIRDELRIHGRRNVLIV